MALQTVTFYKCSVVTTYLYFVQFRTFMMHVTSCRSLDKSFSYDKKQLKLQAICAFRLVCKYTVVNLCVSRGMAGPAHVALWLKHSGAMCRGSNLSPSASAYQRIIIHTC